MRIFDYIQRGGPIMYVLLFLNIVGFAIMLMKLVSLYREKSNINSVSNFLYNKVSSSEKSSIAELARQELKIYINQLEKGMNTIKIIASISPLLGLLGTVLGVLLAFQVMSQTGVNNPSSFAQGISIALITTVGGMLVAIPHYIGHNYLLGMIDNIEVELEQKILEKAL